MNGPDIFRHQVPKDDGKEAIKAEAEFWLIIKKMK